MHFLKPCDLKYNKHGIKNKDAPALRTKYGSNRFTRKPRNTFLKQYLSAFGDPIIKILLVALFLNLIIAIHNADIYEPLGIAVALFLATFVSTLSEYGSESAFLKLESQSANVTCRVYRDGKLRELNVCELVVTDTVILSAGERVPADGVVVSGSVLVDESPLNGESREVRKEKGRAGENWDISDPAQLFRGSVITGGECVMTVGRTGDSTLYGKVASEIQTENTKSPLTERLSVLAGTLAKIGYCAAILVFFADLFGALFIDNNFDFVAVSAEVSDIPQMISNLLHALTLAITVVVVAVPEGLPMMITVVLSSNMNRLRRDNVLVRRLTGIETGGCVNILFCDKTGTLTKGKLSVRRFYDKNGKAFDKIPVDVRSDVLCCALLCNESKMTEGRAVGGNATDRALLSYCCDREILKRKVTDKIPFDSARKFSAAYAEGMWYIKGAPEVITRNCKNTPKSFTDKLRLISSEGKRVIAVAKSKDMQTFELLGMFEVEDALRGDAKTSVKTVQGAGISVCMVTGDSSDTAKNIAARCGILKEGGIALESSELSKLSDEKVAELLPRLQVVSRALPSDKSRLVRISKNAGLVCAMTGDGINDAPALRHSDVGFAMGSGTEVAKQAGDIVIIDDNFTSIAKAILYGRTIFKSIRKFIVFQLTMNLCAVGISILGPFIGIDTPITVMQMLWINIIMDTLAGLAFAGEMPAVRYMREKPLKRTAPVLNGAMTLQISFMGVYNLALCTFFLTSEYFKKAFGYYTDYLQFMTAFFVLFVFGGVFGAFTARCDGRNIFRGIGKNPAFTVIFGAITAVTLLLVYMGGEMFRTVSVPPSRLLSVIALAFTVIPFEIIRKTLFKLFKNY